MMLALVALAISLQAFASNHHKFDLPNSDLDTLSYATNLVDQLINRPSVRKEIFVVVNQELICEKFLQHFIASDVAITVVTWKLFSRYDIEGYNAVASYTFNAPILVLFEEAMIQGISNTIYDIFNQPGTKAGFKILLVLTDFSLDLIPANITQIIRKSFIKYHDTVVLFKLSNQLQAFLYQYNVDSTHNVSAERNVETIFKRRRKRLQIYQKDDPPRSRVIDGKVTGMDGLYLQNYVHFMRVDYTLVSAEYEMKYSNSDLSFNIKDLNSITMEASALFYISQFWRQCFLVPKANPESIIDALLTIMAPTTLMVLLLANLLFGLLVYLILRQRPSLQMEFVDVYFELIRSVLTNSMHRRMRTPFERITFTAHIVCSFVVLNATLCFMKQFLVSPRFNDINTIDQLNRSELQIIGSDVNQYLAAKWFDQPFADKIVPWVHSSLMHPINRSFAYILPDDYTDQYIHSNENYVNGVQQMHKMEQHFSEYFRGFMGKIDDYNTETMHFYLSAIEESGIRQHWKWVVRNSSRNPEEKVNDKVAITLQQLRKLFLALLVGYGVALMTFIGELLVGRCH